MGCNENVLQIFAGIFNIAKHFLYVTKLERFLEASEMELYTSSSQNKSWNLLRAAVYYQIYSLVLTDNLKLTNVRSEVS